MKKIDSLDKLPSVDRILKDPKIVSIVNEYGVRLVTRSARMVIQRARSSLLVGKPLAYTTLIKALQEETFGVIKPSLRPVINLTGVVLHTNLGRASLPLSAIDAVIDAAACPSNLEMDLKTGKRGDRNKHCEDLICQLTGSESAIVVNNNAAAVLVTLNSLAKRKEVPVSRGELVEIGGSFRMPDIMAHAGCKLVEVGTTNRTYQKDFEMAISSKTALIMKVHTSNFEIQGFVSSVTEQRMAEIAHCHNLPFVSDLGSGNLIDFKSYGLPEARTVIDSLKAGADLVTFSGDKLLGGPQCGIIAGRNDLVKKIKKNPLIRAMRADKMTLAALNAILRLYTNPEKLAKELPTLRLLNRREEEIRQTANSLMPIVQGQCPSFTVSVAPVESQIGSGALPITRLASAALKITTASQKGPGKLLERLARAFRDLPVPVLGRINKDALWFDLRCLEDKSQFIDNLKNLNFK